MADQSVILVIGATGCVGRQVVSGLLGKGAAVRAVTRDPGAAALPSGAEVVRADLSAPRTLDEHMDGVGAVFLIWPFFTADAAPAVLDVIASQAHRVVYLSAMSVRDDREPQANGIWGEIEQLIEKSGLAWTFLRASGFAANTLAWADQIRADGVVRWPYGEAARSLIHERDIAAVAVRALTEKGHAGAKYVLTGPETVTQAEQVHIIGEAAGQPVCWEELSPGVARQQLLAAWGDPGFVDGALGYWATLTVSPEQVTREVEEVTGSPARTFREWAIDHAADFRSPPQRGRVTGMRVMRPPT
jgi:uncharacterized protein YbjT (DUF2867 family)